MQGAMSIGGYPLYIGTHTANGPTVTLAPTGSIQTIPPNANSFVQVRKLDRIVVLKCAFQITGANTQFHLQCGSRPTGDIRLALGAVFNQSAPCTLDLPKSLRLSISAPASMSLGMHSGVNSKGVLVFSNGNSDVIMLVLPATSFLNVSGQISSDLGSQNYPQIQGTGTIYLWQGANFAAGMRFNFQFLNAGQMVWDKSLTLTFTVPQQSTLLGIGAHDFVLRCVVCEFQH